MQAACAQWPPLDVRLTGVWTFGERAMSLAVDSPGARDLHLALLKLLGTPPGPQDDAGSTPHLSLALG